MVRETDLYGGVWAKSDLYGPRGGDVMLKRMFHNFRIERLGGASDGAGTTDFPPNWSPDA
jgi:hypothetical protein